MHDQPYDHAHEHAHAHNHSHTHDPEAVKAVANRLARAIGHLESVRQMVLAGRDCAEVLTQLSAVRSALNNAGVQILKNHMEHCMVEAVAQGDAQAIEDLSRALERYLR